MPNRIFLMSSFQFLILCADIKEPINKEVPVKKNAGTLVTKVERLARLAQRSMDKNAAPKAEYLEII